MLIAVLSDIHSNVEALDAALADARAAGVERTWVLGDNVGYGADPGAVLERLGALDAVKLLAGNHDLAAVERFDPAWFNSVARDAILWTAEQLDDGARELLESLQPRIDGEGDPVLVHGSIVDPVAEYITNEQVAVASFEAESFELCFFGHTHLPSIFTRGAGGVVEGARLSEGEVLHLQGGKRYLVNPGSVGQPRDRDPRASWLLYDDDAGTVTVHRVPYDVERAQAKIREAGLPDVLADRLAVGR